MSKALVDLITNTRKDDLVRMAGKYCKHGHTLLAHPKCFQRRDERVGILDIETSDLCADYGFMLSYCIKEVNGPLIENNIGVNEIREGRWDKRLVENCVRDIQQFDRLVGWYSSCFDIPFIRTRALKWGIEFPRWGTIWHTDLWNVARKKLKLRNNRLQTACELFGVPAKDTRLTPEICMSSRAGDSGAIAQVLKHNIEDVYSTEELYWLVSGMYHVTKSSI